MMLPLEIVIDSLDRVGLGRAQLRLSCTVNQLRDGGIIQRQGRRQGSMQIFLKLCRRRQPCDGSS